MNKFVNGNRPVIIPVIVTVVVMILLMTLYEIVDHKFFSEMTVIEEHIITIAFSTLFAAVTAFVVLRRYFNLLDEYKRELSKKEELIEEIKDISSLLETIFESSPYGILVTDADFRVIKFNKKFVSLFGEPGNTATKAGNSDIIEILTDGSLSLRKINDELAESRKESESDNYVIGELKDGRYFEISSVPYFTAEEITGSLWTFRDVTRQKQYETEIRIFHSGIEHSTEAIYITDAGGAINFINPAFEKIFGYSYEEAAGKSPLLLAPEEKEGKAFAEIFEKLQNNHSAAGEFVNRTKDGRLLQIDGNLNTILDSNNNVIGFMGIHRDITRRKNFEKGLKESERKYKDLFEKSDDANLIIVNGVFTDCNSATVRMLGFKSKEELLNCLPADLSPRFQPDGRDSYEKSQEMMAIALRNGSHRFEWAHRKADGTIFPVEVLLTSINSDEKPEVLHTTWRDISSRKKSERLRTSLFEIAKTASSASDMGDLYKKIHQSVELILPVKNIYIALYDDKTDLLSFPYMVDEYDSPYEPQKPGRGLTELVLRKGEPYLVNSSQTLELKEAGEIEIVGTPSAIWLGVPLMISGKAIGVITVQDYKDEKVYGISEMELLLFVSEQIAQVIDRKQKEEEIRKYAAELAQINSTKDKLFSIIAHDLRSPFNPIMSLSEVLDSEIETLEKAEIKKYAADINRLSNRVYTLMENLLDWSRMQSGTIRFRPEKLNLKTKSEEVISHLSENALKKNISLANHVETLNVAADEHMIISILQNLMSNAIKFSYEGGTVDVSSKISGSFIEVCVTDQGVGIPEERIKSLFRPEASSSTIGTNHEKGSGLGLLLCKDFVEKHGGTLRVESEPGKGSVFTFTIPVGNQAQD